MAKEDEELTDDPNDGGGGGGGGGYGDPFDFAQMVAGGAGGALGGIVDIFAGMGARREANKELGLANQNLEKVLGNQPSLSTPGRVVPRLGRTRQPSSAGSCPEVR